MYVGCFCSPVPFEVASMEILYEDSRIAVCIKPPGVLSTDEPGGMPELLRTQLKTACIRTVHRLDRVTGGIMVFARSRMAASILSEQVRSGTLQKEYLAVLHGAPSPRTGTLDTLIGRRADKKRMKVVEPGGVGQRAVSHWEVLARHGAAALVEFKIETGRTHQIRVHAAHLGHPVFGDRLYGVPDRASRLLLHAVQLEFPHPVTGKPLVFAAEPPPEIVYAG